jgi:epoxyqueuosine reductase
MLSLDHLRTRALEAGFDLAGAAPLDPTVDGGAFLRWLEQGMHAGMGWMARPDAVAKRLDPRRILPGAASILMVGLSYEAAGPALRDLRDPRRGRIARYAWGLDYHDVLTPALRALGETLAKETRAYVDPGPILERAWAERCGLGFIGRNTCLIHPKLGSYVFLGAVLLGEEVEPEPEPRRPIGGGCGGCTRCLTACPTGALPQPGVLDARRCISYLTIEHKGEIPAELQSLMGNWVFGCDDCQDVCPYVKRFSQPSDSPLARQLRGRDRAVLEHAAPLLEDLLALDQAGFDTRFGHTPVARTKLSGLLRNARVAAGNGGVSDSR